MREEKFKSEPTENEIEREGEKKRKWGFWFCIWEKGRAFGKILTNKREKYTKLRSFPTKRKKKKTHTYIYVCVCLSKERLKFRC